MRASLHEGCGVRIRDGIACRRGEPGKVNRNFIYGR